MCAHKPNYSWNCKIRYAVVILDNSSGASAEWVWTGCTAWFKLRQQENQQTTRNTTNTHR